MTDSALDTGKHRSKRRRFVPLVWVSGVAAAGLLALGVSGTLSGWTSAIINNNTNTVASGNAVVLQETGPTGIASPTSATCYSTDGSQTTINSSVCSTINKYGGVTTPLTPGANQTADVTFTNVGSEAGSIFKLTPGACSQTPTAGTGTPVNPANLCTNGDLTVALSCSAGATYVSGSAFTDLVFAAAKPSTFSPVLTHATGIAKNASVTCRFTLALSTTASPLDGGITVSQGLVWELDQ
jgi:hypothetical protein